MNFTEQDYLNYRLFQGEEGELSLHQVKLVKARKQHECFFGLAPYAVKHKIKVGDIYRYEKALVDGDFFGEYRVCLSCLDKEMSELYGV